MKEQRIQVNENLSQDAKDIWWWFTAWLFGYGRLFVSPPYGIRMAQELSFKNPAAWEELLFSLPPDTEERRQLMGLGNDASCRYNEGWLPFHNKIRARRSELSESEAAEMDWFMDVHGW